MKIFDVRDRLSLLVKQTTQVGIGFLVMLLLTGGRMPMQLPLFFVTH